MRQPSDLDWAASVCAAASFVHLSIEIVRASAWAPHPKIGWAMAERSFEELGAELAAVRELRALDRPRAHLNAQYGDNYGLEYVERQLRRYGVIAYNTLGATIFADVVHEAAVTGCDLTLPPNVTGASPAPAPQLASQLAAHIGRIPFGSGLRANQRTWNRRHPQLMSVREL